MMDILERLLALHAEAKAGRVNIDYVEGLSLEAAEEVKKLRVQIEAIRQLLLEYFEAQRSKATAKK